MVFMKEWEWNMDSLKSFYNVFPTFKFTKNDTAGRKYSCPYLSRRIMEFGTVEKLHAVKHD